MDKNISEKINSIIDGIRTRGLLREKQVLYH